MQPPNPPDSPPPSVPRVLAALALIMIGLLIFLPSGLCTGFFLLGALIALVTASHQNFGLGQLALVIGGPFVVLGGFILWSGFRLLSPRKPDHD